MFFIQVRSMALFTGLVLALMGTVTEVSAFGRAVVVNGQVLAGAELEALDRAHCMRVPDGNYFLQQTLDGRTVWGYAALPGIPQGYLGEECGSGQSQSAGGYGSGGNSGWSDEYSRTYGGGVSAGDGTVEIFDGASGGYIYE
jgi:hypothetical protein